VVPRHPGFIGSDDVYARRQGPHHRSFNRCDRGDEYVDHHTLFCVMNEQAGMNTSRSRSRTWTRCSRTTSTWPGSQVRAHVGRGPASAGQPVYDYWSDPWGRVHERWADTDRLNARSGTNLLSAEEGLVSQWGEDPPERFLRHVTTSAARAAAAHLPRAAGDQREGLPRRAYVLGGRPHVRHVRQPPPRRPPRGRLARHAAGRAGSPRLPGPQALLRAALRRPARLGRHASRQPPQLEGGGDGRPRVLRLHQEQKPSPPEGERAG